MTCCTEKYRTKGKMVLHFECSMTLVKIEI